MKIYGISCKTSAGPKPLRFRLDKIDRFIRLCVGVLRHLVLFYNALFDKICDKVKYFISEKSSIAYSIIQIIDSYNYLPIKNIDFS